MTEIKLHTYGEKLIVSEKVTLASGNINSAELHVTVDEAWAAYSNFSATFETKEYIEPVEKLMVAKTATEYVCVIPSEVLQHQGILEIGIRGISNDGEMAKTSSIAKYNIVKGASPGNITLKPTMDMYQQYLAAMDSKTAPLFNAYKEAMDADYKAKTTALEEDYQAKMASLSGELLWENPEPTAGFEQQEIRLDLAEYKRFILIYKSERRGEVCKEVTVSEKEILYEIRRDFNTSLGYYTKRTIRIDDTQISFSAGSGYYGGNTYNYDEDIIPYKLYGFKW